MEPVLEKLSSILTLAVLAGIWVSLHRRIKSARFAALDRGLGARLCPLSHAALRGGRGNLENLLHFIKLGSLQLASVFFIASLTSFLEDKKKTRLLIAVMPFRFCSSSPDFLQLAPAAAGCDLSGLRILRAAGFHP